MLASLPMYDFPELRKATDAWWNGLRNHLCINGIEEAPGNLERTLPVTEQWSNDALIFSQTCGYPYWFNLRDQVRLIATPAYEFEGCTGSYYRSVLLVNADSSASSLNALKGGVCAVNGLDSQSGYNTLRNQLAPLARRKRFFRDVIISGAHAESIRLVANNTADLCAVDCVTWGLLKRHRKLLADAVRVLGWTDPAPGLPYVCSATIGKGRLNTIRGALDSALADPDLNGPRSELGITGAARLPTESYQLIAGMENLAQGLGYAEIV